MKKYFALAAKACFPPFLQNAALGIEVCTGLFAAIICARHESPQWAENVTVTGPASRAVFWEVFQVPALLEDTVSGLLPLDRDLFIEGERQFAVVSGRGAQWAANTGTLYFPRKDVCWKMRGRLRQSLFRRCRRRMPSPRRSKPRPRGLRQRAMEKHLRDELQAADPEVARVALRDIATSWRMRRLHDLGVAENGTVPVAMLTDDLAKELGSKSRVVLFSEETAAKIQRRHAEVAHVDDYKRVLDLIEHGEILKDRARNLMFVGVGELPWIAVVKATMNGEENYLTTFYRVSSSRYVKRLRSRSIKLR